MEIRIGELGLRLSPGTLPHVICYLPRTTPSPLTPHDLLCIYCQLYPLPQPPPSPSPSTRHQPLLPACVISFRDSLACLLLACFRLSPTPPAGCLLPCPPPESVTAWGRGRSYEMRSQDIWVPGSLIRCGSGETPSSHPVVTVLYFFIFFGDCSLICRENVC